MLSASPEKRVDLRRLFTLISYLEDGETRGGGGAVENNAMKALEEVTKNGLVMITVTKAFEFCGLSLFFAESPAALPYSYEAMRLLLRCCAFGMLIWCGCESCNSGDPGDC